MVPMVMHMSSEGPVALPGLIAVRFLTTQYFLYHSKYIILVALPQ